MEFNAVVGGGDVAEQEEEEAPLEVVIESQVYHVGLAEDDMNASKKTLFATFLWSGARVLSEYLTLHACELVQGKAVVELGAGGGLPSMVCRRLGASRVVATDFPAPTVLTKLAQNVLVREERGEAAVIEHVWGSDVAPLLAAAATTTTTTTTTTTAAGEQFDVALAAECLWRHETHAALARSLYDLLKPQGRAIITFSHHIAGLEANDLAFFDAARDAGFEVQERITKTGTHMWSQEAKDIFLVVLLKS